MLRGFAGWDLQLVLACDLECRIRALWYVNSLSLMPLGAPSRWRSLYQSTLPHGTRSCLLLNATSTTDIYTLGLHTFTRIDSKGHEETWTWTITPAAVMALQTLHPNQR